MNIQKIVPCIWLTANNGQLTQVLNYYKNVFGKDFQANQIVPLGKTPSGNSELCEVSFFGQQFSLMSTEIAHQPLNDAVSFMINCENQQEIDHFWNYFTREGKESQCGWCIDKYGIRWQIVPANMEELMALPGSFDVMMRQKKIIIDEYLT